MTISTWLRQATKELKDIGITSARLDAELILSNTLRKTRTYLHAHLDETIDPRRHDIADARLSLRLDRVPLAYILGYKEFYGRPFIVSPSVLIPRPESEDMISLLLEMTSGDIAPKTLIDIGTGSGCLGITAKLERPNLLVTLSDISTKALTVAEKNATALQADVFIQKQSLLSGNAQRLDYILANLPYVDKEWEVSPELRHEPDEALYARRGGLALIEELLQQAPQHCNPGALVFLEADPVQHPAIISLAANLGLQLKETRGYIIALAYTPAALT
ncbi:MAG: HemK/PrmC family methyltransferase [Candidatus Saccharibacteria bacterium]|nr:HemK/PrmC family methyltransferase [Candidatus Saccharibacteria bacterium]